MDTIQNYKCPCCGAPLVFDALSQNLHCDSCENEFSLDTMQQLDEAQAGVNEQSKYDWEHYEPRNFDAEESVDFSSYSCPSCGAQITGDDTMGSSICPYCGNSTIVKGQFEGVLKPDYIIPFKLDKGSATEAFERACKQAPFLPDEFKDKKKISEITGVYVPFWMFDCDCDADIIYNAQSVMTWSDSNYRYVKTNFYKIFRSGSVGFANIPVDGSQKADDTYMESVEPYDYTEAVDFNTAYLSGYFSDKYDVSAEESVVRANERIKNSTQEVFRATVNGYGVVVPERTNVRFMNGKIRYSLLPVWMLNIRYQDKMYKYAINGQTGKVAGEYPVCKRKKWLYFAKTYGISLAVMIVFAWILAKFW